AWTAERGFHLANHLSTVAIAAENAAYYRAHYRGPGRGEFVMAREIIVADTDAEARELGERALQGFWRLFAQPPVSPSEPLSDERMLAYTARFRYIKNATYSEQDKQGVIVTGGPDTVARRLREICALAQPDSLLGVFSFGGLTHAEVCRSLRLFAREVMPALRGAVGATR